MRSLLISDLHGNIDALRAVEAEAKRGGGWDFALVLGDLVDYGPDPMAVIQWVRGNANVVIRGNHDNAMVTGTACGCSHTFLRASETTRDYFRSRLPADAIAYLKELPARATVLVDGKQAELVHATPLDPMFQYLRPGDAEEEWLRALAPLEEETEFLFIGHTHLPFVKKIGTVTVVNPGSVGQPRDGDPRASYAIVEDRQVRLMRVRYDVDRAIARLQALGYETAVYDQLSRVLRSGA